MATASMASNLRAPAYKRGSFAASPTTVARRKNEEAFQGLLAIRSSHSNHQLLTLMGEAWELLEIHPATPELWKPNIKSFLARCLDEVPYISQWVWAVRQMRERLTAPASSKRYIKAPFRWFETVLRSKSRGRCSRDAKAAMTARKTGPMKEALETKRKWAKYFWLKAHQGKKAAHSYAIHAGLRAPHKLTIALKKMTAMMAETTRLARAGALDDHVPDAETVKIEMARAFAWHQERKAMHRMGWESLERTPEEEAGWWN